MTPADRGAADPNSSMFSTRVATAVALLAIIVSALFYLPNFWWKLILLPALFGASWEWSTLSKYSSNMRWCFGAVTLGSALVLSAAGSTGLVVGVLATSCIFWLLLVPAWLAMRWRVGSGAALAVTGWVVLVPTWLALGELQMNPARLLAILGVVWLADTGAYLAGRAWGRRKLAAEISPGKTWEGVAGGLAAVAVYYGVLSHSFPEWDWWDSGLGAVLFLGVAVASMMGDLFESWMKRQAGAKDSGSILPGHGGILDRIDSMTSSMPIAAALLYYAG